MGALLEKTFLAHDPRASVVICSVCGSVCKKPCCPGRPGPVKTCWVCMHLRITRACEWRLWTGPGVCVFCCTILCLSLF